MFNHPLNLVSEFIFRCWLCYIKILPEGLDIWDIWSICYDFFSKYDIHIQKWVFISKIISLCSFERILKSLLRMFYHKSWYGILQRKNPEIYGGSRTHMTRFPLLYIVWSIVLTIMSVSFSWSGVFFVIKIILSIHFCSSFFVMAHNICY